MTVSTFPQSFLKILVIFVFSFSITSAIMLVGVESAKAQDKLEFSGSEYGPDGIPVLLKNLPDWKNSVKKAKWVNDRVTLVQLLGERPVFETIDFSTAVEAVFVEYPEGKLLLLEYGTPQLSSDADARFTRFFTESPNRDDTVYKRIGNYNAFVFDPLNEVGANSLLDQIYYGKLVQWLGEDPNLQEKLDRYFASTTAQVFLSTVKAIVLGLGIALVLGVVTGLLFFRHRQKQRRKLKTFSDAGGMIRINLDGFSDQPEVDE
jgi:hypothetical protein